MTDRSANHFYDFARFRLDAADGLLLRDGHAMQLPPRIFEILLLLVQHHGHVLTKEELINKIWPDSFVEESNLARNISTLRQLLGDSNLIETVPRRGYRFVETVSEHWQEEPTPRTASSAPLNLALIRSVAVLPFQPLNAGECDLRLGLRIADAVITRLSSLGKLIVLPTSAVRKYDEPDHDPLAVGGELKVDAVLGGSLQQLGERIRLTIQLLNVCDGLPLLGAQFETRFTDFFAVIDSLSEQVSVRLFAKPQDDVKNNGFFCRE